MRRSASARRWRRCIGAPPEDVIAVDNTTLNIHKLLAYGLQLARPDTKRRFIVYEPDGFPTDAHVVQGIVHHGRGAGPSAPSTTLAELAGALRDDVAMVVLAHVDYRSSYRWDLAAATAACHAVGARALWDLSHSAGVVAVGLAGSRADFAVVCGYKYLSSGPGAPALAYIRHDLQDRDWPALPGWLGHADRMNFRGAYAPAPGPLSLVTGTMPVLQNAVDGMRGAPVGAGGSGRAVRQAPVALQHAGAIDARAMRAVGCTPAVARRL